MSSNTRSGEDMHRSASHSAARPSDEFPVNFSSSALKAFDSSEEKLLADYDDKSQVSDDSSKVKPSFGEKNSIHLIPLVLIFCALLLWWFSKPVQLHWTDSLLLCNFLFFFLFLKMFTSCIWQSCNLTKYQGFYYMNIRSLSVKSRILRRDFDVIYHVFWG